MLGNHRISESVTLAFIILPSPERHKEEVLPGIWQKRDCFYFLVFYTSFVVFPCELSARENIGLHKDMCTMAHDNFIHEAQVENTKTHQQMNR